MQLVGGQCVCEESVNKPNEKDQCSRCMVEGCLSCAAKDEYKCLACQDGLTLEDGECVCPVSGHKVNDGGACEECEVEGCVSCVSGNPQQCARCKDCSASIIDGLCTCLFADAAWREGMCVSEHEANATLEVPVKMASDEQVGSEDPCRQEGCVECEDGKCSTCTKGKFVENGKCEDCDWKCMDCSSERECRECRGGFRLDSEDKECHQCKVRRCRKCDEDVDTCEECKEGYDLKDGKCEMIE